MTRLTEPWSEKYRPRSFEEVVGNSDVVETLESMVNRDSLVHCLFVGPPGVGKTALAHVVGRAYLGETYLQGFLEVNGGSERGIDKIRTEVDEFMRGRSFFPSKKKILYIDEINRVTRDALMALNRKIELYAANCVVIGAANEVSSLLKNEGALYSRFKVFALSRVTKDEMLPRLQMIRETEGLDTDVGSIAEDAEYALGNVRYAINEMQVVAAGGVRKPSTTIDALLTKKDTEIIRLTYELGPESISDYLFNGLVDNFDKGAIDQEQYYQALCIWQQMDLAISQMAHGAGQIVACVSQLRKVLS